MPTPIVNLSLGTGRWLIVAGACFASFVGCTFEGAPVDSIEPEDAAPNDCVAECVDESTLRSCPDEELIQCSLGCDSGTSECIPFAPSNGALDGNTDLAGADAVLEFASDATIDTDTGEITGIRAAGEGLVGGIGFEILPGDIGLFVVFDLSVDSGVTVSVVGQRALLLLARRDVVIEGLFNASAGLDDCGFGSQLACRGPGGGDGALDDTTPGTGCGPGEDGRDGAGSDETGAGGGAMGEAGADGGDSGVTQAGGDGGTTAACPLPELVPLRGGSGGGFGGEGGAGGGGGGAIQIAAFGVLTISGDLATTGIWTGGSGGVGGGGGSGGGGGGSGGAILLEASSLSLSCTLAANGGGGGEGNGTANGANGVFGSAAASGGTGSRDGGDGGALGMSPTQGSGGTTDDGTGGGGGGGGIIRLNAPTPPDLSTSVVSPTATTGDLASD